MRGISKWTPAALVTCLFLAIMTVFVVLIRRQTGGMFVYPLDDSYIHLVLARTLLLHHVLGINGQAFASASSSPGWTFLLSAFDLVFGVHLLNALLANVLFGVGVIFAVDYGLRSLVPSCRTWVRYLTLLLVLFGTPLPNLAILGMEHMAQTLTALLFLLFSVQALEIDPQLPIPDSNLLPFLAVAAAAGAFRYEAVLMVVPVCLLLIARRRMRLALLVGLCSAVMPILFGLYLHHKSGMWLPFSVIVKSADPTPTGISFLTAALHHTNNGLFRPVLCLLGFVWLIRLRRFGAAWPSQLFLLLTILVSFLHLVFAPVGWMMRYESYLYALALFALSLCFAELTLQGNWREILSKPSILFWAEACFLLLFTVRAAVPVWDRVISGLRDPVRASVDRYYEHIQMARFVSSEYDHDTIMVNDIGTIAYYSDAHLLDLIGLGSARPAIAIHQGHPFRAADVSNWAISDHASIAILQSDWRKVADILPPDWIKVATWVLPRNLVFHDYHVNFYAIHASDVPRLCTSLMKFQLPSEDKIIMSSPACEMTSPKGSALYQDPTRSNQP